MTRSFGNAVVVASHPKPRQRDWKALQVRLDHDLYEWLRAKSFFERRSMNVLVLDALRRTRAGEAPHEAWRNQYTAH